MPKYKTKGVCASAIDFEIRDGIVTKVSFEKGCNGNGKGISSLAAGMRVEDVIKRLKGTTCSGRGTSCPDQLAHALETHMLEAKK